MFQRLKNKFLKKWIGFTNEEFNSYIKELNTKKIELISENSALKRQLDNYVENHTCFTKEVVYDNSKIADLNFEIIETEQFTKNNHEIIEMELFSKLFNSTEFKDCATFKTIKDEYSYCYPLIKTILNIKVLKK